MNRLARRLSTIAAAALVASPALVLPATQASASVPAISASAFGMHFLQHGSYPSLGFASARIWDDGVTWAKLQPNAPTHTAAAPPTPLVSQGTPEKITNGIDTKVVAKLDAIVRSFVAHHADPMITLGMTPAWAADTSGCNYGSYGVQTCLPKGDFKASDGYDFHDPWRNYVSFLSTRYDGHHSDAKGTLPKVTYFELWNEPNYRNGMNGSWSTAIPKLAKMQATAYGLLHARGQKMVSPGIPFTVGGGYTFLDKFLKAGGKKYDALGLHLYPSDATATGGYGPEWVMNTVLVSVRKILSNNAVAGRPMWDTETNVGRMAAHNAVKTSTTGAAYVARTFILATQNKIARTFWYAADDHAWGGVWLENSNYTRSTAGNGYQRVRARLVGKAALGCSRVTVGTHKWKYTCKFGTTTGHKTLLAIWTTGANYTLKAPAGTKHWYDWKGTYRSAYAGKKFTISHTPIYLVGSFR